MARHISYIFILQSFILNELLKSQSYVLVPGWTIKMFIENNDGTRTKAIAEIFEDFFCRRRDRRARKGTGVCARCGESSGGSRKRRRSPASVKIVRAFAGPMPGTVMSRPATGIIPQHEGSPFDNMLAEPMQIQILRTRRNIATAALSTGTRTLIDRLAAA